MHYSSARAELAGALVAITVPWSMHLALDNKSVVDKLNDLLRNNLKAPKRPWSLHVNGDLWELIHAILCWRGGAVTTRVSWCKGHAQDFHVDSGITDVYQQWGNRTADREACAAHDLLSDCEHLCSAFCRKQNLYADFLSSVHAMFVRVIRAEKELRSEAAARLNKFVKLKLPHRDSSLLQAAAVSLPRSFEASDGRGIPTRLDAAAVSNLHTHDKRVYCFLCNSQWVEPINSLGTSWLELLIAYASNGGTLLCSDHVLKMSTF